MSCTQSSKSLPALPYVNTTVENTDCHPLSLFPTRRCESGCPSDALLTTSGNDTVDRQGCRSRARAAEKNHPLPGRTTGIQKGSRIAFRRLHCHLQHLTSLLRPDPIALNPHSLTHTPDHLFHLSAHGAQVCSVRGDGCSPGSSTVEAGFGGVWRPIVSQSGAAWEFCEDGEWNSVQAAGGAAAERGEEVGGAGGGRHRGRRRGLRRAQRARGRVAALLRRAAGVAGVRVSSLGVQDLRRGGLRVQAPQVQKAPPPLHHLVGHPRLNQIPNFLLPLIHVLP